MDVMLKRSSKLPLACGVAGCICSLFSGLAEDNQPLTYVERRRPGLAPLNELLEDLLELVSISNDRLRAYFLIDCMLTFSLLPRCHLSFSG